MPTGHLEHVNITVSDPERSAMLLAQLCGWHERWRGPSQLGGWTIHVGGELDYIAVYTRGEGPVPRFGKGAPLNHVGLVVDDLDAAEAVVKAAGLEPFNHGDYEPGRRFYFFDWDGIEFELVSYA
jgi:catechol 2,3-dioxygenase-like lactoylglutathione lyase family enzyme